MAACNERTTHGYALQRKWSRPRLSSASALIRFLSVAYSVDRAVPSRDLDTTVNRAHGCLPVPLPALHRHTAPGRHV